MFYFIKFLLDRKGTPLVIGIVGASFIIPFILFVFYMWNRQFKSTNGKALLKNIKFV